MIVENKAAFEELVRDVAAGRKGITLDGRSANSLPELAKILGLARRHVVTDADGKAIDTLAVVKAVGHDKETVITDEAKDELNVQLERARQTIELHGLSDEALRNRAKASKIGSYDKLDAPTLIQSILDAPVPFAERRDLPVDPALNPHSASAQVEPVTNTATVQVPVSQAANAKK